MLRLDIYQVLPREVTTARSSIDSFTGARRFVHRGTNVSRVLNEFRLTLITVPSWAGWCVDIFATCMSQETAHFFPVQHEV